MDERTLRNIQKQVALAKEFEFDLVYVALSISEAETVLRLSEYPSEEITHQRPS